MYRFLKLFLFLLGSFSIQAQIVNVESLRKATDTARWSGSIGLDVGFIKNKNEVFRVSNRSNVQHRVGKSMFLFINDLNFQKLEGADFVNRGIQHLRYNYDTNSRITWELFLQGQYDAISNIDFRGLIGAGPRFKFDKLNDYKFYLGSLVMYEYEKTSEEFSEIRRDLRASIYLAFKLFPKDNFSIASTTYFQPRLNNLDDYRLSNETSLAFKIFKDLSFKSSFILIFDRFPAFDTPQTQYELTNGLIYSFD